MKKKTTRELMHNCLYFTANAMARTITRMADEAFRTTGLSPSHAFLMMLVIETPGTTPTQLSRHLALAPSTVTRLVDSLQYKGFLERKVKGKTVSIFPTGQGESMYQEILSSWKSLHMAYAEKLGLKQGDTLTRDLDNAVTQLNRH